MTAAAPFDERGRGLGLLAAILVVAVYGLGAAVAVYPLALPSAMAAASLGAMLGAIAGPALARTRLRAPVQLACAALVVAGGYAARALVTESAWIASGLGPATALVAGDALFFGVGAMGVAMGLRWAGTRRRVFVGLELAVVGAAFAQLLLPHRNNAIHRPFELADPIIAAGFDPTMLFLAAGAITAVVLASLLMRERSPLRGALHVGMGLLLLFALLGTYFLWAPCPEAPVVDRAASGQTPPQPEPRDRSSSDQPRQVPVAVVVFHDEYSPPDGVYYFRQSAVSQFNGQRLVGATRADVDGDLPSGFPTTARAPVVDPPPSMIGRQLLETTVGLLADHPRPFGLEAPVELAPAPNPDPARFRRMYRVTSGALTADLFALADAEAGNPSWTREQWAHYTEVPPDPRYAELAQRIVEGELPDELRGTPAFRMQAVRRWLGREGVYSLRRRDDGEQDPAGSFLFGDRIGYCVHFAHAAVNLFRSLGLPARVAQGYAVPEAARQGGSSLVLTDGAAHAWPEVYFAGYGWVVADVYPERYLDPPPPMPDPELQRLLGEMARGQHQDNPVARQNREQILAAVQRAAFWTTTRVLAFALGLLSFLFVVKTWRRLRPLFASERAWPRVAYRAELDRLSELSLRRAPGESREAFAERVAALAPTFRELTAVHVGAAFGSPSARARAARLRGAHRLSAELRRAFPTWRRVLGALDPFSWLLSR